MADQFLGEIRPTGFNFAPIGWALCQGQLMSIQQNAALFSLLGTQFGGNGTSTFGLPNLQGNVLLGQGKNPSGSTYEMGETGGAPAVTLTQGEMPTHTHAPAANAGGGANLTPLASIWSLESDPNGELCTAFGPPPGNVAMSISTILPLGGGQPLTVTQPYLAVNYIISLSGSFPPRS